MKQQWIERPEGGNLYGLRLIRSFALLCGRSAARIVLYPITLYYLLRRDVDATDYEDVYIEESTQEEPAKPQPAAQPAGRGVSLPVVSSPPPTSKPAPMENPGPGEDPHSGSSGPHEGNA